MKYHCSWKNKHKRGKDSSVIHFKNGIRSFCCFL